MSARTVVTRGESVRDRRQERGWTQEELSHRSDVSVKAIQKAESGGPVIVRTVADIARTLEVDVSVLLPSDDQTSAASSSGGDETSTASQGIWPQQPPVFVGREADVKTLLGRLAPKVDSAGQLQVVTAVRGWPGIGKTTLAAVVAHDELVKQRFADGVLWTSLGATPDLRAKISEWGRALGLKNLDRVSDPGEISRQVTTALREKRYLLVIDDVWDSLHAQLFAVGGAGCATLVTTRKLVVAEDLASSTGDIHRLEQLTEEDALALLTQLAGDVVENHQDECLELVRELEGLPLAIHVAGRMLRSRAHRHGNVRELIDNLKADSSKLLTQDAPPDMADLLSQTKPTVAALLKRSTDSLSAEMRDRFADLGCVPVKPVTFGLKIIGNTWDLPEDDTRRVLDEFVDLGLVEPAQDDRYQIHSLLLAHARTLWNEDD